jgi:hypothetical protein
MSSSRREEELINAYEAEEEKIINVLSRKLEKVGTTVICRVNSISLISNGDIGPYSYDSFGKKRLNSRTCLKLSPKLK